MNIYKKIVSAGVLSLCFATLSFVVWQPETICAQEGCQGSYSWDDQSNGEKGEDEFSDDAQAEIAAISDSENQVFENVVDNINLDGDIVARKTSTQLDIDSALSSRDTLRGTGYLDAITNKISDEGTEIDLVDKKLTTLVSKIVAVISAKLRLNSLNRDRLRENFNRLAEEELNQVLSPEEFENINAELFDELALDPLFFVLTVEIQNYLNTLNPFYKPPDTTVTDLDDLHKANLVFSVVPIVGQVFSIITSVIDFEKKTHDPLLNFANFFNELFKIVEAIEQGGIVTPAELGLESEITALIGDAAIAQGALEKLEALFPKTLPELQNRAQVFAPGQSNFDLKTLTNPGFYGNPADTSKQLPVYDYSPRLAKLNAGDRSKFNVDTTQAIATAKRAYIYNTINASKNKKFIIDTASLAYTLEFHIASKQILSSYAKKMDLLGIIEQEYSASLFSKKKTNLNTCFSDETLAFIAAESSDTYSFIRSCVTEKTLAQETVGQFDISKQDATDYVAVLDKTRGLKIDITKQFLASIDKTRSFYQDKFIANLQNPKSKLAQQIQQVEMQANQAYETQLDTVGSSMFRSMLASKTPVCLFQQNIPRGRTNCRTSYVDSDNFATPVEVSSNRPVDVVCFSQGQPDPLALYSQAIGKAGVFFKVDGKNNLLFPATCKPPTVVYPYNRNRDPYFNTNYSYAQGSLASFIHEYDSNKFLTLDPVAYTKSLFSAKNTPKKSPVTPIAEISSLFVPGSADAKKYNDLTAEYFGNTPRFVSVIEQNYLDIFKQKDPQVIKTSIKDLVDKGSLTYLSYTYLEILLQQCVLAQAADTTGSDCYSLIVETARDVADELLKNDFFQRFEIDKDTVYFYNGNNVKGGDLNIQEFNGLVSRKEEGDAYVYKADKSHYPAKVAEHEDLFGNVPFEFVRTNASYTELYKKLYTDRCQAIAKNVEIIGVAYGLGHFLGKIKADFLTGFYDVLLDPQRRQDWIDSKDPDKKVFNIKSNGPYIPGCSKDSWIIQKIDKKSIITVAPVTTADFRKSGFDISIFGDPALAPSLQIDYPAEINTKLGKTGGVFLTVVLLEQLYFNQGGWLNNLTTDNADTLIGLDTKYDTNTKITSILGVADFITKRVQQTIPGKDSTKTGGNFFTTIGQILENLVGLDALQTSAKTHWVDQNSFNFSFNDLFNKYTSKLFVDSIDLTKSPASTSDPNYHFSSDYVIDGDFKPDFANNSIKLKPKSGQKTSIQLTRNFAAEKDNFDALGIGFKFPCLDSLTPLVPGDNNILTLSIKDKLMNLDITSDSISISYNGTKQDSIQFNAYDLPGCIDGETTLELYFGTNRLTIYDDYNHEINPDNTKIKPRPLLYQLQINNEFLHSSFVDPQFASRQTSAKNIADVAISLGHISRNTQDFEIRDLFVLQYDYPKNPDKK